MGIQKSLLNFVYCFARKNKLSIDDAWFVLIYTNSDFSHIENLKFVLNEMPRKKLIWRFGHKTKEPRFNVLIKLLIESNPDINIIEKFYLECIKKYDAKFLRDKTQQEMLNIVKQFNLMVHAINQNALSEISSFEIETDSIIGVVAFNQLHEKKLLNQFKRVRVAVVNRPVDIYSIMTALYLNAAFPKNSVKLTVPHSETKHITLELSINVNNNRKAA